MEVLLTLFVADVVGSRGTIVQDTTKPDGTPRKLLDVSRLTALGWRARIGLRTRSGRLLPVLLVLADVALNA